MKLVTKQLAGSFVMALIFNFFATGLVSAGTELSAAKIDAYVNASIAVAGVVNEWGPKINAAKSEEEGHALKVEANAALATAIEKTEGITVDEYKQLMDASRSDPSLKRKLDGAIKEKLGQ